MSAKKRYFLGFTLCFVGMTFLTLGWYLFTGKTFIWYGGSGDGWRQHFRALVYYGQYLRRIVRTLLYEHRLVIPSWEFALGEGADLLQSLHYYVVGDPLAALSVFVPTRYMHLFYDAMMLLRLYFSGVAFSCLCFQFGRKNPFAICAGAISYMFCQWMIWNVARHPYFLNPMIYLPLLIMGFERIIQGRRPYLLIAAVFLSAVSNFYFFYILVIISVVYMAARMGVMLAQRRIKLCPALGVAAKITGAAALGALLAGFILAPILYTFLQDGRSGMAVPIPLLYPSEYYGQLFAILTGHNYLGYWLCGGFSALVLPAILLTLRRRGCTFLKILLLLSLCAATIPVIGKLLNGFAYVTNRWSFALALLLCYLLVAMWPQLMHLHTRDVIFLTACIVADVVLCIVIDEARHMQTFAAAAITLGALLLLAPMLGDRDKPWLTTRKKQWLALGVTVLSITANSFWRNAPQTGNYADEALDASGIQEELTGNETAAVRSAAAADGVTSFYRYAGLQLNENAGLTADLSSTQYYWSLSNPNTGEFRTQMELPEYSLYRYHGYDERASLNTLAAVRYFTLKESALENVPYGFVDTGIRKAGYKVYRNQYALPLAYCYDAALSQQTWDGLSAVEKQEAILQAVFLQGEELPPTQAEVALTSVSVPYEVAWKGKSVRREGNSFVVTRDGAAVNVNFTGLPNSETYLRIGGLTFRTPDLQDASVTARFWKELKTVGLRAKSANTSISKTITWHSPAYSYYNGRDDFCADMGYMQEPQTSITITFPFAGVYTFAELEVICQPMDAYAEQVAALGADTLHDLTISDDSVSGTITLSAPQYLCLAIPYSAGWQAYVDGAPARLYQANVHDMALALPAGEHTVELRYRTPYFHLGAYLSAAGAAALIPTVLFTERRRKKQPE